MSYYMFYLTVPEFIFILMTYCKVLTRSPKKNCRDSAFPCCDTAPMFTFVKNYKSVRSPVRLNLCDGKKFLRCDSLAAKKFLLLNYSKRKEVLAVRRTQAQSIRNLPQEVARLADAKRSSCACIIFGLYCTL